jgi:hypothetical protein
MILALCIFRTYPLRHTQTTMTVYSAACDWLYCQWDKSFLLTLW